MLLLASASPARRRLLEQAGIPHRVMVSGVDEDGIHADDPRELVQKLAQAKASAVRERLRAGGDDASVTAVLGCDSVLAFDGEVFGKPADAAEAITRWQRMRGRWGNCTPGTACWQALLQGLMRQIAASLSPRGCCSPSSPTPRLRPTSPLESRCSALVALRWKAGVAAAWSAWMAATPM